MLTYIIRVHRCTNHKSLVIKMDVIEEFVRRLTCNQGLQLTLVQSESGHYPFTLVLDTEQPKRVTRLLEILQSIGGLLVESSAISHVSPTDSSGSRTRLRSI